MGKSAQQTHQPRIQPKHKEQVMTFAKDNIDTIRRDQIDAARSLAAEEGTTRPTLRLAPGTTAARNAQYRTGAAPTFDKKKNVLKGHEAFLKSLECNGARVEVEKKDGTVYRGTLKHTDKYTITLHATEVGNVSDQDVFKPIEKPRDRVIFKHDMSEFSALTPRPAPTTEGNL